MSNRNPDPAPPLDFDAFNGHTPGPWASNLVPEVYAVREPGNCPEIASLPWSRMEKQGKRSEALANAALIAAAPALLAECRRLRAENESMRLAGRELAADLDAAESLIYDAYENLADEDELRAAIRERREEKAELATYLKNLPEVTEAKHE